MSEASHLRAIFGTDKRSIPGVLLRAQAMRGAMVANATMFLALILVPLKIAGCGGSASLDCDAFCEKSVECDATQKADSCMARCAAVNDVGESSYLSALQACAARSCAEINDCGLAAWDACNNDLAPLFDDVCSKESSCNSSITQEACHEQWGQGGGLVGQILKCLDDATLSQIGSCAQAASCETFYEDVNKCIADAVSKAIVTQVVP